MSEEQDHKKEVTAKITQMQEFSDEFQKEHQMTSELDQITAERDQLRAQLLVLEEKCQRYESQLATTLHIASNTELEAMNLQVASLQAKLREAESVNKDLAA